MENIFLQKILKRKILYEQAILLFLETFRSSGDKIEVVGWGYKYMYKSYKKKIEIISQKLGIQSNETKLYIYHVVIDLAFP